MADIRPHRSSEGRLRRMAASYGLDERSLAVFRIALGLVVLVDLIRRFQHSSAMYTDDGIFARGYLLESINPARWSLLFINGSQEFANLFFMAGIVATIALIIGWKTRLMTVAVWIAIMSVQYRNPHLQNGADTLIRVTMFWAMFLPLGRCWSLDSLYRPVNRSGSASARVVVSVATFALILQNAVMYFFTAILKSGPKWQEDGSALYYALGARQITTGFGEWIFQHAPLWLLSAFTFGTLLLEFALPLMLLLPLRSGWLRALAVFFIVQLHLGILATMTVGFFPVISIAVALAVLPTWFWERVLPRATLAVQKTGLHGKVAGLRHRIPSLPARPAFAHHLRHGNDTVSDTGDQHVLRLINQPWAQAREIPRLMSNLICIVAIGMMLAWNLQSVTAYEVPRPVQRIMVGTGLYQTWSMFAPGPPNVSSWIIVQGVLESGEKVDLLVPMVEDDMSLRLPVDLDQRDQVIEQDKYWRKLFQSAKRDDDDITRIAAYACRSWNDENSGDDRLTKVTIAEARSKTQDDRERTKPVFDQIGSWKCR